MSYHLAPIANQQQIDADGDPLSGGKIYTYIAGTSTPATTYTDDTGATPQANPIILNSRGVASNPVWVQGGRTYKIVITDANDVQLGMFDDVPGINDTTVTADQWVVYANAPTYLTASSFSVAGDQTPTFQPGRRLKTVNTAGIVYSSILTATYAAGVTTITVANDSGSLDSGLSAVSYGVISVANTALPLGPAFSAYQSVAHALVQSVVTKIQLQSEEYDTAGAYDASTFRFTPKVAGYYQITGSFSVATTATRMVLYLYKNGAVHKQLNRADSTGQIGGGALVHLNGTTDYVELYGIQDAATQDSSPGATVTYFQGALVRAA
jgi:hypothetical protein